MDQKFKMEVQEGQYGPLFIVTNQVSRKTYPGDSCSEVWRSVGNDLGVSETGGIYVRM